MQDAFEQIQLGIMYIQLKLVVCWHVWKNLSFFGLKVGSLIFSSAKQLSINLQSVEITIQEGAELHLK